MNSGLAVVVLHCLPIRRQIPSTPAPPGHPPGPMNMRHPGMQFGPRGMGNRPDGPMRFLGPGGPRQGHPMGPHFPGPDGMGPRHRGPMMMRMQRPPGPGRGAPNGPRPLLPELVSIGMQFGPAGLMHRFILLKKYYHLQASVNRYLFNLFHVSNSGFGDTKPSSVAGHLLSYWLNLNAWLHCSWSVIVPPNPEVET